MVLKDLPIRKKIRRAILLTSVAVLLLTCSTYFAYEFYTFRQATVRSLSILGEIISTNSTAALAFDNADDANEILAALKAEPHIVAAGLYDGQGKLFSRYPVSRNATDFPEKPDIDGYNFGYERLEGFQPVLQGTKRLGTLYLRSDLGAIYQRLRLYGLIAMLVVGVSLTLAFILSNRLQVGISRPILALAETAKAISERHDYSVRVTKVSGDEVGQLTDAFNQMLVQIQAAEDEIKSFNQLLEQKVAERTKELEVANKELESFSYSVSHDLRAPLRSIHGYMNIFTDEYADKFDDEARKLANIVISNTKKMGQLIDDLLAFSRLGRKELTRAKISMQDMVVNIWEEQTRLQERTNIDFTLFDLPEAMADRVTIRQVWENLISNAIKYSKHTEKAVIEIGFTEKDDLITFYVRDNGAGFSMEYYDKLFGVFQRLHSQKEFEGTGVGLAIVQRIVFKHGGTVWAQSKIGEGSTFFFTLSKSAGEASEGVPG